MSEWQYGGQWAAAVYFINIAYGAEHPVRYYLYGGGGGWYSENTANGFSDVGFANAAFAAGLAGWSNSGDAGVVANASRTPAATGEALGTPTGGAGGWFGYSFTVGNAPLTVYDLGRWVVAGDTGTHTVALVDPEPAVGGQVLGTASINTNGRPSGQFAYAAMSGSVVLAAESFLLPPRRRAGRRGSASTAMTPTLTPTSDITINSSEYATKFGTFSAGTAGDSYGPVNSRYTTAGMGNPDAPPLFSAIAAGGGATESGNVVTIVTSEPQSFAPGQSVVVWAFPVGGYDGAFTVLSVTATTLSYYSTGPPTCRAPAAGWSTARARGAQTAFLKPGRASSQAVTFSGGYADITLYAAQNVAAATYHPNSPSLDHLFRFAVWAPCLLAIGASLGLYAYWCVSAAALFQRSLPHSPE